MRRVTAAEARSAIAWHVLGAPADTDERLGTVTLHVHQAEAVERIRALLDTTRGALLADDVGLGKTFTALAIARDLATIVLAPAALRETWTAASKQAGTRVAFTSFEELSRGVTPAGDFDLVIADEAHHLRTPGSNRFAAARALCRTTRVLLLSATPVQNSDADLRVLLSLFLGELAFALPAEALGRYVVRRTADEIPLGGSLPAVRPPTWLPAIIDGDCLDRILALPPATPPLDGGDAGVLASYVLARQWASSRAALLGALRRRLARGLALADALRAGRLPTRGELAAWTFSDGSQQLSFPELVRAAIPCEAAALLRAVEAHVAALRDLVAWLAVSPDPDAQRAAQLREVLSRHAGGRVVAFSEFADTVARLYDLLAVGGRVAMLTHTGGRVAGGPMSRAELIRRFAPGAARVTNESERIDLLLTTDVLSEGVGLHDASVVVHLDLAWNPARLEQRVGRVRRLGAPHSTVHVYLMRPPAAPDRLLRMEERLQGKLAHAGRTVGRGSETLPGEATGAPNPEIAREQRITSTLVRWRLPDPPAEPVVAGVRCDGATDESALVCVRAGRDAMLLAVARGCISDTRERVERAIVSASGSGCEVPDRLAEDVVRRTQAWLARRSTQSVVDLTAVRVARSRRFLIRRVDGISRRTPRHSQARVAPLIRVARDTATARLSAGAERVLDELARASMPDEAWLRAVGEFAALHAGADRREWRVEVVLLLLPPR